MTHSFVYHYFAKAGEGEGIKYFDGIYESGQQILSLSQYDQLKQKIAYGKASDRLTGDITIMSLTFLEESL